jgi:SRSO17 transposase
VSLSLAHDEGSLPVAFDLYLPEEWPPIRFAAAGIPKTLAFRPRIALEQIRRALAEGLPSGVVLGDAAYGIDFRTALTALSLSSVLGVQSTLGVWPPGPLPPKPGKGRQLQRRDAEHQPVSAKDLAVTLPPRAWQTVSWRAGSRGGLSERFAAVRVRPRDYWRAEPHPEEWLLIEWPEGDKEPQGAEPVLAFDCAGDDRLGRSGPHAALAD